MTKNVELIKAELIKRFEANNWNEITITLKYDGSKLTIKPCGYGIRSVEDCEYFLTYSETVAWFGINQRDGETTNLEAVCRDIANYADVIAQQNKDIKALKEFRAKMLNLYGAELEEAYGTYSDWYKDVYGHRPHDEELSMHIHASRALYDVKWDNEKRCFVEEKRCIVEVA